MTDSGDITRRNTRTDSASNLPRRRFFNEMPDKGLFGFVAIFGFSVIIALKLHKYDPDKVAALAVALMLFYGVIAYRMPGVQLRLDRLGDNFYYLGFIYTLASMSAALIELRADEDIKPLIGSFGIALFTTIVGVAGRVMFVQMRTELDEIETQSRRDLLATSNALSAQLALVLREFETFITAIQQATDETHVRTAAAAETQAQLLSDVGKTAANEIKGAFEDSKSQTSELTSAVKRVSQALDRAAERIANMELPSDQLSEKVGSFGRQLDSLVAQLEAATNEVQRLTPRRRRRWYWPFRK